MNSKQNITLAELKVGIFVVIVCAILALAIFAIGSQVGLFEEQFGAITYLSNVSGLKPGDIVLLGGVEVGNVVAVNISKPGELPQTVGNTAILQKVAMRLDQLDLIKARIQNLETLIPEARNRYTQALQKLGEPAPETVKYQSDLKDLEERLTDERKRASDLQQDIESDRAGLQNIEVELQINQAYRDWIRLDSSISLGSVGLLGDKYIEVSLGRSDSPPLTVTRTVKGWLGSETRELVLITGTQQASFGELITGANDILANFRTLSDQVQRIVRNFESGEGTVGRFLNDPSFFENLNSTVQNANRAMEKIGDLAGGLGEGRGTVSRLLNEDVLYQRMVSAIERLESLTRKIEEGDGTAGRLVNDPAVYDRTREALENIRDITARINRGEGTLGKLATDDKFINSAQASIDQLSALLQDVQDGKGTLGKLAKDEELYRNLNQVSSEMVKLLYDFRQNPKKFLTIRFELF